MIINARNEKGITDQEVYEQLREANMFGVGMDADVWLKKRQEVKKNE